MQAARMTVVGLCVLVLGATAWGAKPSRAPLLTAIPGGSFIMGDHHGYVDPHHPSDELPLHQVSVDAFLIGTYELTNREFCDYLNAAAELGLIEVRNDTVHAAGDTVVYCFTHASAVYSSIGWNGIEFSVADFRENHPVVGVMWYGAAAYCNWLSIQSSLPACYDESTWTCDFDCNGFRLPTEAEWEYAGRGGQYDPYFIFPWGNDSTTLSRANWPGSGDPYETGSYPWTTPVGFYNGQMHQRSEYNWPGSQSSYQTADGSNAWGLHDMAGNVWEFVHDWYGQNYYSVSPDSNPPGPATGFIMPDGKPYRGMRGGNWYNGQWGHARVANRNPSYYRGPQDPDHPWYHVGFRVARSAGAAAVTIADTLVAGWNLLSNPVIASNDSVRALFPASALPYVFAFEAGSGYTQSPVVMNGSGYWGKFDSAGTVGLTGTGIGIDSVNVVSGWNLAGTISARIDTAAVLCTPPDLRRSAWYGYDATGYSPVRTLVPGHAYWVKAGGPGIFILTTTAKNAPQK
jgi:formylglycine-generating enzyme required for sulfatase activity